MFLDNGNNAFSDFYRGQALGGGLKRLLMMRLGGEVYYIANLDSDVAKLSRPFGERLLGFCVCGAGVALCGKFIAYIHDDSALHESGEELWRFKIHLARLFISSCSDIQGGVVYEDVGCAAKQPLRFSHQRFGACAAAQIGWDIYA